MRTWPVFQNSVTYGLTVGPCGFLVCEQYPFLGVTPDGTVYDPTNLEQPF